MIFHEGDFVDKAQSLKNSVLVFSANSTITNDRRLVMGAGAAKRVRDFFPNIDRELWHQLFIEHDDTKAWRDDQGVIPDYHLVCWSNPNKHREQENGKWPIRAVEALQVKRHWKNDSIYDLVDLSLEKLKGVVDRNPDLWFVMNCPSIGLGGLKPERIIRLLQHHLGDFQNVIVCVQDIKAIDKLIRDPKLKIGDKLDASRYRI